ncbi:hypothetical protein BASA81_011816 [Batrachochytrium salamandrivorans]|nr:hypothetical protein BASA81_011816 [Batrachochytrium salamandrivorans]
MLSISETYPALATSETPGVARTAAAAAAAAAADASTEPPPTSSHPTTTIQDPTPLDIENERLAHLPPPPSLIDSMSGLDMQERDPVPETVAPSGSDGDHSPMDDGARAPGSASSNPLLSFIINTAATIANGLTGADMDDDEPLSGQSFRRVRSASHSSKSHGASTSVMASGISPTTASPQSSKGRRSSSSFENASLGSFIWDFFRHGDSHHQQAAFQASSPLSHPLPHDGAMTTFGAVDEGHSSDDNDGNDNLSQDNDSLFEGPLSTTEISSPSQEALSSHADVKIQGRNAAGEIAAVLDYNIMQTLHPYLPPLLREASCLDLLYSIEQHGISLNTLYRLCAESGPCLLALRDDNNNAFGAFANESLQLKSGFFGNGTCFLWKQLADTGDVLVYPATGNNEYLILNELHCIAFGGGQGHFGLWMDGELFNGHSGPCDTFGNDNLSSTSNFHIVALEVWGFKI